MFDVVIVGGGPGGLAAALTLGRARKRTLLLDAGPRRNARAVHIHNFVTRDGSTPDDFRQLGRQQLTPYPNVEVRDEPALDVTGSRGAFALRLSTGTVQARRVLLCTGMIDEPPAIDGLAERWGHSVYQCPYCHGWEVQDRPWGYLVLPGSAAHMLPFALQARAWTREVTVFTGGAIEIADDVRAQLAATGMRVEHAPLARLHGPSPHLEAVELTDGTTVPCAALFTHPPQRHVPLVQALGLALDDDGLVKTDPMRRETSVPGLYAAGDLTTRGQAAIFAASAAVQAAAMINMELTMARVLAGEL